MFSVTLQTERLLLKSITPALVHHLFETLEKEQIIRFLGIDESEFDLYRLMHEKGMETFRITALYFLLVDKETHFPIGTCGFHTWNQSHNRAEIFYKLTNDSDKRKGFVSEALPVVLKYGFDEMALHRIEAFVADYNIPSVRLLLKNGFVKEGTAREHYLVDGVFEDSDFYSLLKKQDQTK